MTWEFYKMKTDDIILGKNTIYSTDSKQTGLNNNVLVVGGSGSGKTMSCVEPLMLRTRHSNLITTVTKRRIVTKYMPMFKSRGYNVVDLNLIDPKKSKVCFDPLQYIQSYEDISSLADAIVSLHGNSFRYDPYWDEASKSLLTFEIAAALLMKDHATMADVIAFNDQLDFAGGETIVTSFDSKLSGLSQDSFVYRKFQSFAKLPRRTAACVYGTLKVILDTVFTPSICSMIERKKTIDFDKFITQPTVLFVSTSAVDNNKNKFVNLFYAQCFKSLFEYENKSENDDALPIPVRLVADDFATGARIPHFQDYISIFREKSISVMILLQSESQLKNMYGESAATTIINNCDTYLYLGGNDLSTAHSISERLNAPLEDVLNMPIGQEFIFRRGIQPRVTKRYNILQDVEYQQVIAGFEKQCR